MDFSPRDGELVELRGRLGVYEQRGDLQLVVESMQRAGQGALFEQFLRLKARLEAEGLFDAARKRSLPPLPRGIGVVTSPGRSEEHTSELQSPCNLVCRLLLEKKKKKILLYTDNRRYTVNELM